MTEPGRDPTAPPRTYGWRHPAVLAAGALAVASGFAQFGPTAALGEVAAAFGEVTEEVTEDTSLAAQAGLSGTTLGVGLALIRLASLASLPLSAAADGYGRRRVVLAAMSVGLALTAVAAFSPGFWWFVAIIALGRPTLAATNAILGVIVVEEARTADRAKGVALLTVGYGMGAGLAVLARFVGGDVLTFRGLFLLATVPLLAVPFLGRLLQEPARFVALESRRPVRCLLAPIGPQLRRRLLLVAALAFSAAFLTAPVNAYLFVYGENVLRVTTATTAALVPVAAAFGALGLLIGRWSADVLGRRPSAAMAQIALAIAGTATYAGSVPSLVVGYIATMFAGSLYAPAMGALSAELFPTRVRATAAGWLTVAGVLGGVSGLLTFGVLADLLDGFGSAAAVMAVPVALASLLFVRLPETRGLELEQSAPDMP